MSLVRTRWVRWVVVGLVLVALLGAVGSVQAVEVIESESIPKGVVIDDDVFIGGENVVVDGTVNGDLLAFGNTVTVNGTVRGSLVTAAQTIVVNGDIDGSIYAAGYALTLGPSATVGRNLYFGGFGLQAAPGSYTDRDLIMGGYQAVLSGEVGRDVKGGMGALEIKGKVGRDVVVDVGETGAQVAMPPTFGVPGAPPTIASGLRIGSDAEIGGKLTYTSPVKQDEAIESAPGSGVVYQTPVPTTTGVRDERAGAVVVVGRWILRRLRELATLLILGALVLWLLPDLFTKVVDKAGSEPMPSAGWGLLTWFGGYFIAGVIGVVIVIVAIILGVVLGLSSLSLAFTLFLLLVKYASKLVVSFLVGKLLLQKIAPKYAEYKAWPMVLGVVLYVVLRSVPFVGWLVGVAATLVGLGAMCLLCRERYARPKPEPVEE